MYLREIVINGFKSFAEKTRLELQPGMTAVVGPNGCGKSNIADAIRWVLGEQSAKALRGGKMQDVIFEGSETRKPLSLCEVSLTFTDCEKELGTSFNEVQITRRVSRDGSSDYFLNGKASRLKDIQRLFMDTGVGRVSYSFLVQGQIDQILSTNPAERRVIFEEAAGITRYKSQRREALNKLSLVDANLARVTDVIEEVGRQINTLKRQASKALRYRRINHRLSNLEQASIAYHYQQMGTEIRSLDSEYQDARGQSDNQQQRLSGLEAELQELRESRDAISAQLQEAQERIYQLRSEKESAENKVNYARARQKDLSERRQRLEQEALTLNEEKARIESETADTVDTQKAQQDLVSASDLAYQEKHRRLLQLDSELQAAEKHLQAARTQLLTLENGITRLRSRCTHLEVELKSFEVKHAGLAETVQRLAGERQALNEERVRLEEARDQHRERLATQEARFESARTAAETGKQAFRQAQQSLQEADRQLAQLAARLSLLESQQEKLEGVGAGPRAVLQGKLGDLVPVKSFRRLTEVIECPEADTPALEALLGPLADLLLPSDPSLDLHPILEALRSQNLSHTWFLDLANPAPVADSASVPAGLRPVLEVIKIKDESLRPALAGLFGGCWFANSLEDLLALRPQSPDFSFRVVAAPSGEIIESRGTLLGGRAKLTGDSPLRRENAIRALKAEIDALQKRCYELREASEQSQKALEAAEQAVEDTREERDELRRETSTMENQLQSVLQRERKEGQSEETARRQLAELESENSEAKIRLEKARTELAEAESAIEKQKTFILDAEMAVSRQRDERDQARDGLAGLRLELAEKAQALEQLRRTLGERRQRMNQLATALERNREEAEGCQTQVKTLEDEAGNQAARVLQVERTLNETRQALEATKEKLKSREEALRTHEEAATRLRQSLSGARDKAHKLEVSLTQTRTRQDFLLDRLRSAYQLEIDSLDWKSCLWQASQPLAERIKIEDLEGFDDESLNAAVMKPAGEPDEAALAAMEATDWAEVEKEVETLRERIQALGAVNLVAIEEYADLRQRYDFLKQQSDDLWTSKEELIKAIDAINETSQELFRQTFEQVRKNFAYTYDQLTGGGKADLELLNHEDVLESGIEIIARPPGTRLQGISRLSGGQRTMTAVALLFAIYMVKPSPFCVLDELDAPLDDANIGRFVKMLQQFLQQSQFVIITHNKSTISAADTVFGVTMQEKGVSRILSMRFQKEDQPGEAASALAS